MIDHAPANVDFSLPIGNRGFGTGASGRIWPIPIVLRDPSLKQCRYCRVGRDTMNIHVAFKGRLVKGRETIGAVYLSFRYSHPDSHSVSIACKLHCKQPKMI